MNIQQKAKTIQLVIFDVDGVLTDGGLYFSDEDIELKRFNALDGLGIKLLQQNQVQVAIISARSCENVRRRMQNLAVQHYYQDVDNKLDAFTDLLTKLDLSPHQVAYVGDDIIDLPVMQKVGLAIAVNNAHELVQQHADMITKKLGGHGAVREVCDFILKSQDKYDHAMQAYLQP
jgi:3-deoxy-D-manno-octulosonate 8-phosphate phosphatase (KDO 8-P phosphatase)